MKATTTESPYFTYKEASSYTRCERTTLYPAVKAGRLRAVGAGDGGPLPSRRTRSVDGQPQSRSANKSRRDKVGGGRATDGGTRLNTSYYGEQWIPSHEIWVMHRLDTPGCRKSLYALVIGYQVLRLSWFDEWHGVGALRPGGVTRLSR